jgi:hypothetical protein
LLDVTDRAAGLGRQPVQQLCHRRAYICLPLDRTCLIRKQFYAGYIVGSLIVGRGVQRFSIAKYYGVNFTLWGITLLGMIGARNCVHEVGPVYLWLRARAQMAMPSLSASSSVSLKPLTTLACVPCSCHAAKT